MASSNTKRDVDKEGDDLYITPLIALDSFYDQYSEWVEQFDVFLDPCDGLGAISDWLESKGKKVYRWDLKDYRGKLDEQKDFLSVDEIPEDVQCIIFNPPFKLTKEFVDKALQLCPNLLMFNRLTTIESNTRANKFHSGEWPLKDMFQFGFRVSCPKGEYDERGDMVITPSANSVAYSWFHLSNESDGNMKKLPRLHWITNGG